MTLRRLLAWCFALALVAGAAPAFAQAPGPKAATSATAVDPLAPCTWKATSCAVAEASTAPATATTSSRSAGSTAASHP